MYTYAQNFEDVMLARLFVEQKTGFYIDVGASHPESLSVTKWFYDNGWSGINVEPIPENYRLFKEQRPRDINLNVAVDVETVEKTFYEALGADGLSTFDSDQADFLRNSGHRLSAYPVKTITLNSIFEQYVNCTVDFLKIDVEGAEETVLRSLDLKKFRPRVLVIEATKPGAEFAGWDNHKTLSNWGWENLVTSNGYSFVYFDGLNRFYVRAEDYEKLAHRFELPPGYFDDIYSPQDFQHMLFKLGGRRIISGLWDYGKYRIKQFVRSKFARTADQRK